MARSDETTHKKNSSGIDSFGGCLHSLCAGAVTGLSVEGPGIRRDPDIQHGASLVSPCLWRKRNPRVQVFYYGVLVDDTSLPFEARMGLRSRTYIGRFLPALIPPTTLQARRP